MTSKPARARPSMLPDDLDLEDLKAKPGKAVPQPAFHELPSQGAVVALHPPAQEASAPPPAPPTPVAAPTAPPGPASVEPTQPQPPVPSHLDPVPTGETAGEGTSLGAVVPVTEGRLTVSTGGDIKARAVNLTVYLLPDDHKRLRRLAVERDTSIQSLVMDGIDRVFEGADLAPVQRWEPKRKVRI